MSRRSFILYHFKKLFPLGLACFLVSCETLQGPSESVQSLLVGNISYTVKDFDRSLNVNGTHVGNVQVTFANYKTKHETVLTSEDNGLFVTEALPPGNYSISKISFKETNATSTYEVGVNPSSMAKFVLVPGAVTNLGQIVCQIDANGDSSCSPERKFERVRSQFRTLHSKTAWLSQDWKNTIVTRDLDFDLDLSPPVTGKEQPRTLPADFYNAPEEGLVQRIPDSLVQKQQTDPDGFLTDLVAYLTKDSPNDFETVKRLHDWVTDNIAYDTPDFLSGKTPDQSYLAVLKTKIAVCEGYANIFKRLCEIKGIPCAKVSGFSRGYGSATFSAENPEVANHAWNIVKINQKDYLVDTTWDAGTLENQRFQKKYSTTYLFTDPKYFIYSHFPSNSQYQLLANQVDVSTFKKLPSLDASFFQSGIKNLTDLEKVNSLGNDFDLQFQAPTTMDLMAALYSENGETEIPYRTFKEKLGDVFHFHVSLPGPGRYVLRLFKGDRPETEGKYVSCGEYGFIAEGAGKTKFPTEYSGFKTGFRLLSPFGTALVPGQAVVFRVDLPGVPYAYLVVRGVNYQMFREGDTSVFSARFTIPDYGNKIDLATQQNLNGELEGILQFDVDR